MTLILTLNKPCRILKIAKINVTLMYYILCRIYWPTTFRGPTKTTTITITGSDETSPGTREYRTWWVILMYRILTKERPWVEHLTSLPRTFFWVFLHLTMKEHPCHVYSNLMPSKQIIVMYNRTTCSDSKPSPDGTQCSGWHHVTMIWCSSARCAPHWLRLSMQRCHVVTFGEVLHKGSYLRYV